MPENYSELVVPYGCLNANIIGLTFFVVLLWFFFPYYVLQRTVQFFCNLKKCEGILYMCVCCGFLLSNADFITWLPW